MKFLVPNYSCLTSGLPPPDLRSLCPLSSTEFVEPPPRTKFLGTPLLDAEFTAQFLLSERADMTGRQHVDCQDINHATCSSYVTQHSLASEVKRSCNSKY